MEYFQLAIGYFSADYLNKDMMIGLAIVNPIYFMCAMIGVMKSKSISIAIILGAVLAPIFYIISPEWCILFGGTIGWYNCFFYWRKKCHLKYF